VIADYQWEWLAGSSSQEDVVQVLETSGGRVLITQQIQINTHHGGHSVGASYDPRRRVLTCSGADLDPPEGRCCPSLMDVVTFRWNGAKFVRVSGKRHSLPEN
jgi:hypothetical protein